MIVSEKTYAAIAAGGSHVTRWQAKKVRVEILNPIEIRTPDGVIQEREGVFDAFQQHVIDTDGSRREVGCPAEVGTVKPLRYRDKRNKTCGRLQVVVTSTRPFTGKDGRPMWEITWERVGTKHRPIPDGSKGVYLAVEHGYTSSPQRALDPDAPVIPDASVLAAIADDAAFTREQRRKRLLEVKQRAEIVSAAIDLELASLDADLAA